MYSKPKERFLKKVRAGASANSFGIHVAQLAGVPSSVLDRAREILDILVTQRNSSSIEKLPDSNNTPTTKAVPQLFSEEELVLDELLSVDTNAITPMEALQKIDSWKKILFPSQK